jgi:hypothetical protein
MKPLLKRGETMATTSTVVNSQSGNVIRVTIQVDKDGEVQSVNPKSFVISKGMHQQVLWQASDSKAHFNIDFGDSSPFEYSQFSDAEPYSGLVRRDVLGDPGKNYEYTVRTGSKSIDPGGYVKP